MARCSTFDRYNDFPLLDKTDFDSLLSHKKPKKNNEL